MNGFLIKREPQKIEYLTKCTECESTNISKDSSRGELVCNNCGLVIDAEIIDHGPEWRAFDSDQREKRARVGAPMTYTMVEAAAEEELPCTMMR